MTRPDPYTLDTNLVMGQGIDFTVDYLYAFGLDIREACASIPPIFEPNQKLATVLPFPVRPPATPSATQPHEVPSCLNVTCPNPTSDA